MTSKLFSFVLPVFAPNAAELVGPDGVGRLLDVCKKLDYHGNDATQPRLRGIAVEVSNGHAVYTVDYGRKPLEGKQSLEVARRVALVEGHHLTYFKPEQKGLDDPTQTAAVNRYRERSFSGPCYATWLTFFDTAPRGTVEAVRLPSGLVVNLQALCGDNDSYRHAFSTANLHPIERLAALAHGSGNNVEFAMGFRSGRSALVAELRPDAPAAYLTERARFDKFKHSELLHQALYAFLSADEPGFEDPRGVE